MACESLPVIERRLEAAVDLQFLAEAGIGWQARSIHRKRSVRKVDHRWEGDRSELDPVVVRVAKAEWDGPGVVGLPHRNLSQGGGKRGAAVEIDLDEAIRIGR